MSEPTAQKHSDQVRPIARLLFLGDPRYDRRIKSFANFFLEHGYAVELICSVRSNSEFSVGELAMLVDDHSTLILPLKSHGGPRMFLSHHRALKEKLRSLPPADILIACDLYSLGAARFARKLGKTRVAIYDSREVYTELPSTANRPLVRQFWKWFEHHGLACMDAMLVTGTHDLQAIFDAHRFSPRNFLIRNLPERLDFIEPIDLRQLCKIPRRAPLFVYLGGLQKGRGLSNFIKVLGKIDPEARFVLIGEGQLRTELHSIASTSGVADKVIFLGAIESDQALRMLASADVGVALIESIALSYVYALPSKLFEYLAVGIPTLCSKMVHVEELFGTSADSKEPWLFYADPDSEAEIIAGARESLKRSKDPLVKLHTRELHLRRFNSELELEQLSPLLKLGPPNHEDA